MVRGHFIKKRTCSIRLVALLVAVICVLLAVIGRWGYDSRLRSIATQRISAAGYRVHFHGDVLTDILRANGVASGNSDVELFTDHQTPYFGDEHYEASRVAAVHRDASISDENLRTVMLEIRPVNRPVNLRIEGAVVTDRGFQCMAGVGNLRRMELVYLELTDEIFKTFEQIPNLEYVLIRNCRFISEGAFETFRASHPEIAMEYSLDPGFSQLEFDD